MNTNLLHIVLIFMATLVPISYCIRSPSNLASSSSHFKPTRSLNFPIYHKSHPKVKSYFDSNVVAHFTGNFGNKLYYVEVLFATPSIPIIFVFDTGSMFTWINVSAGYDPFRESSTYVQVSNTEKLCRDVPGNNYNKTGSTCFRVRQAATLIMAMSDNIWETLFIDSCLAFKRSPATINKNILGAKQMPGWTVGIDQVSAEIYFEINVDC